jgi:2-dehydro-3-deoxyphosphogluconate aldolase/(4S)-4-hydroxy-2-oxoglutarate aldolase
MLIIQSRLQFMLGRKAAVVMRGSDPRKVHETAHALARGGFACIEVTMTVPGAVDLIRQLTTELPNAMIGAGTVTTAHDALTCIEAGAQFVVSPVVATDIIRPCREAGVVCIPAGMTPTEIYTAWLAGGTVVKIFPAAPIGGTAFVRALRGPFPDIPLWVSGGVKASEAQAYFEAGAQLVGLNAAEIPAALIDAGEWDAVSGEAAAMLVRAGLAGS